MIDHHSPLLPRIYTFSSSHFCSCNFISFSFSIVIISKITCIYSDCLNVIIMYPFFILSCALSVTPSDLSSLTSSQQASRLYNCDVYRDSILSFDSLGMLISMCVGQNIFGTYCCKRSETCVC